MIDMMRMLRLLKYTLREQVREVTIYIMRRHHQLVLSSFSCGMTSYSILLLKPMLKTPTSLLEANRLSYLSWMMMDSHVYKVGFN